MISEQKKLLGYRHWAFLQGEPDQTSRKPPQQNSTKRTEVENYGIDKLEE